MSFWPAAVAALDGREYELDGVHGVLRDRSVPLETRLFHEPSERGRRSIRYREIRTQLKDHWDTDLTNSERAAAIATELLGEDFFSKGERP